jgi:arylsulfatase A-like enzyme
VRLIDFAPTVLDLIGVTAPSEFEGLSVIPLVNGQREEAPAYLEAMDANLTRNWAPLTAVATRNEKLIDLPNAELYDLRADPHETTNLFARHAERARTLEALLRGMTTAFQSRGSSGERRRSARTRASGCRRSATSRRAPIRARASTRRRTIRRR